MVDWVTLTREELKTILEELENTKVSNAREFDNRELKIEAIMSQLRILKRPRDMEEILY
jgi:hypothetical protein